ncbi:hypothetical protein LVB77_15135 [Lysobacter sp. 5GHs7-4]|uniref:class I SAM-dependent methyltransferase n=1 Tax=Lysobacter sp. 5GHs7-4 TaxID=2904253 RepID=UPI0018371844|nr:class I SAM-dependent methyltransferase [Lysobacter sp. 5GHs7-4]NUO76846.1 class I SAM-dependent methyltransferase [Lysobacter sp.]UHQ21997.1 hypothetical protein LVB77_15135 [Lysobacter sp. 5GHs7-4]
MSLWLDFLTNQDLLIHKWKHYFPIYEQHMRRFQGQDVLMFEIGVSQGGSLRMWKRFLGPHARIVGIDIDPRSAPAAEDQVEVRIGDQSDPAFLQSLIDEFGVPDVVLDDGSHRMDHVNASFDFLYPLLPKNGVYMVEDMHTAYWEEYGGGVGVPGSFIERCKGLIDSLNADHARGALPSDEFTRSTRSMHFYDSFVVFEKGATTGKHAPRVGKPLFE